MGAISFNVTIDGAQASPSVEAIFGAMSDEDKRALATKVMYDYFQRMLDKTSGHGYPYETIGQQFLKQFLPVLRDHIGAAAAADPALKAQIDQIVTKFTAAPEQFIQHALYTMMLKMIADTAAQIGRAEAQGWDLHTKIDMLKSQNNLQ